MLGSASEDSAAAFFTVTWTRGAGGANRIWPSHSFTSTGTPVSLSLRSNLESLRAVNMRHPSAGGTSREYHTRAPDVVLRRRPHPLSPGAAVSRSEALPHRLPPSQ